MPAPYATLGVFGGLLLIGVLVYTIWTQTPPQREGKSYNFNAEPGYDRPRTNDWGNEENPGTSRRRRRRNETEECVICTDSLHGGVPSRSLSCGHTFHDKCIAQWFQESRICPTCRRPA